MHLYTYFNLQKSQLTIVNPTNNWRQTPNYIVLPSFLNCCIIFNIMCISPKKFANWRTYVFEHSYSAAEYLGTCLCQQMWLPRSIIALEQCT